MRNLCYDDETDLIDLQNECPLGGSTASQQLGLATIDVSGFVRAKAGEGKTEEEIANTVRNRAINARILNRMDQKDAAKKLGYHNSSALSKIEAGVAKMPKNFIHRAALAYGVSCDYLLGLSNEPERDPKTAEHMAIIRSVEATLKQQNHSLVSILLKNASDMTPMEGQMYSLLASVKRVLDAFDTICRRNANFQNDVLAGSTLMRAMDEAMATSLSAKSFMDKRSKLVQARTETMCEGKSYPLFDGLATE